MKLFGWEFAKTEDKTDLSSFTPQETDDGALVVTAGGTYGTYLDMEGAAKTEAELVVKYREMALQPELEKALDEVTNEAIVKEGNHKIVNINLDDIKELSPKLKQIITDEFDTIGRLLNFNNYGYEIFRRWYVDGRVYYHAIIDDNDPESGIQELRYIDPRKIRKVRLLTRERNGQIYVNKNTAEFFVYNEKGFKATNSTGMDNQGLRISPDAILHVTSGLMDKDGKLVLSYLHKAIKPLNQLRMLEDATVIYRITRAPERRVFYIDVGQMPKIKAEQHMRDMMTKHKNRLVYDATTGQVRDDRKFMTMLEDYWLPRRDGQSGTEITTLPAGQNLGQMEDVLYFQKGLYKALNVPVSRINPDESAFNLGRSSEITRDELSFQKFIDRLRLRFSNIFLGALEKQLLLKKIFNQADWDEVKDRIHFDYTRDNYYAELKDSEILMNRMNILMMIDSFVGKYYSSSWIKKNVCMQTDEEIEEMQAEMDVDLEQQQEKAMMMADQGLMPDGTPLPPEYMQPPMPPEGAGPSSGGSSSKGDGTNNAPAKKPTELKASKTQVVQGKNGPFNRKEPAKS
jgi:hypothetical protein